MKSTRNSHSGPQALDDLPKIGLVLSSNFESGGGYNYEMSLLEILEDCGKFNTIVYSPSNIGDDWCKPNAEIYSYKINLRDKVIKQIFSILKYPPRFFSSKLFTSSLERQMKRDGISLAYFLSPNHSASIFQSVPMINTV
jgi:hypothetical protein